ncbi:hypothetical protein HZU77_008205 [Neisseriaceae bacterium TC5R-5]|nr:hypothetical protein [Neisseriaceae bacterium TC5R-5]
MNSIEAGALIIENLSMLEEARNLLEGEVEKKVFAAIDELIQQWVDKQEWQGRYDFYRAATYFASVEWIKGTEADWLAWYSLEGKENNRAKEDHWCLTTALAVGVQKIGFRFETKYGDVKGTNKTRWKDFIIGQNKKYTQIQEIGFQFEDEEGTWFLPWQLDVKLLASCYRDDNIPAALTPVTQALACLKQAHPHFLEIVNAVQQEFEVAAES